MTTAPTVRSRVFMVLGFGMGWVRVLIASVGSVSSGHKANQFIRRELGSRNKAEERPKAPCRRLTDEVQSGNRRLQPVFEDREAFHCSQLVRQRRRQERIS